MSLFGSIASVLSGGASNIVKGISGALGGTDPLTGINPIQDYTGITAAKMQQGIAEKNLKLQKNQFDYQKQLNDLQMMREDTAYQRKVKDMTAAGFNPILATGGSGEASAPLKAAPAPQMDSSFTDKYAGAGHALVSGVLSLLSMQKDFAMKDAEISLLRANKQKVEEEAMGIRTENQYRDEYLQSRNRQLGISVESDQFALDLSRTKAPLEIQRMYNDLSLQDKEKILSDLRIAASRLDITGKELDNISKGLDNDFKRRSLTKIDKEIEELTVAIARKQVEFDEYQYARRYFHERFGGSPVGFAFPHRDNLAYNIVRNAVDEVDQFISKDRSTDKPRKFSKSEMRELLKRPEGSNFLWNKNMNKTGDYGVRRNF